MRTFLVIVMILVNVGLIGGALYFLVKTFMQLRKGGE